MKISTAQLRQIIKEEIKRELLEKENLNESAAEKLKSLVRTLALAGALVGGGARMATDTPEERASIAKSIGLEKTEDITIVDMKRLKKEINDLSNDIRYMYKHSKNPKDAKKAEEQLKKAVDKYNELVDSLPDTSDPALRTKMKIEQRPI